MILLHYSVDTAAETCSNRHRCGADGLLERSSLYREFLAEREEILKLKWIESEKAGRDIGLDCALSRWVTHYRALWRKSRRRTIATQA